jgi:hypothetical protein
VYVPFGAAALLAGVVLVGWGVAGWLGVVPRSPELFLTGIALLVSGYLAAVVVPGLVGRINELERQMGSRVDGFERRLRELERGREQVGG